MLVKPQIRVRAWCGAVALCAGIASAPPPARAEAVERSTEHLEFSLADVGLNPFTLTLAFSDLRLVERTKPKRSALRIGDAVVSLSMLRLLSLYQWYVDEFVMSNVHVSLFQTTNGALTMFRQEISDEEVSEATTGSKTRATKTRVTNTAATAEVMIPNLRMDDLNISCDDLLTTNRLWSVDHARFALTDFSLPINKNKHPWRFALRCGLDGLTNAALDCVADFISLPARPYAAIRFDIANIRMSTLHTLFGTNEVRSASRSRTKRGDHGDDWFECCFSNAWNRLSGAIDKECRLQTTQTAVSNFVAGIALSNMTVDAHLAIVISNDTLLPGRVSFTLKRSRKKPETLTLAYLVTNGPAVLKRILE